MRKSEFRVDWKQVTTATGIQDSMLVTEQIPISSIRPLAHPKLTYYESRKLRDDTHEVFRWTKNHPLGVVDEELGEIVVRLGKDNEWVKRSARALSKQIPKLGEKGALELMARVGALLGWLEKGE